jgi:ATP synthase protein I
MSQPDDESQEALKRLQHRLDAFEGQRQTDGSAGSGISAGYRLLGEVIGGVLGGLGLGWFVDRFAHTTPFGMVIGVLAGTGAGLYGAIKAAERAGREATAAKADRAKES